MSDNTYTIFQLRRMNCTPKWNHRIIIPENSNQNIKWKICFTWENSKSLDGKYYKIIPEYYSNRK